MAVNDPWTKAPRFETGMTIQGTAIYGSQMFQGEEVIMTIGTTALAAAIATLATGSATLSI